MSTIDPKPGNDKDNVTVQLPRNPQKEQDLRDVYKEKDAAKDTGVNHKEAEKAWRQAKKDGADG